MSRSLSRIRSLISEIEEIHRQGQQGGQAAMKAASPILSVERVDIPAPVAPTVDPVKSIDADPFLELAQMVNLDEKRATKMDAPKNEPVQEGKIAMQLSGAIALSLQIENTGEILEVKQIGNMLEIRFNDGKAFHIPLKTVA